MKKKCRYQNNFSSQYKTEKIEKKVKKSKKKNVNNFDLSKKRTYAPSRAEEVDSPIPPMPSKSGEPVEFCNSS